MTGKRQKEENSNSVTPDSQSCTATDVDSNPLFILKKMRQGLTQLQREHLDRLWEYYFQNRQWPSVHEYHRGFGKKKDTIEALESIGGNAVVEIGTFPRNEYRLTLLGILLLSDGELYQHLIIGYFNYLKSRFEDDGCKKMSSDEIGLALKLSEAELEILYHLVHATWQLSLGSSEGQPPDYRLTMPNHVDDLLDSDAESYIHKKAFDGYDPRKRVTQKRMYEAGMEIHWIEEGDLEKLQTDRLRLQAFWSLYTRKARLCLVVLYFLLSILVVWITASAFFPGSLPPFNDASGSLVQKLIGIVSALTGIGFLFLWKLMPRLLNFILSRHWKRIERNAEEMHKRGETTCLTGP